MDWFSCYFCYTLRSDVCWRVVILLQQSSSSEHAPLLVGASDCGTWRHILEYSSLPATPDVSLRSVHFRDLCVCSDENLSAKRKKRHHIRPACIALTHKPIKLTDDLRGWRLRRSCGVGRYPFNFCHKWHPGGTLGRSLDRCPLPSSAWVGSLPANNMVRLIIQMLDAQPASPAGWLLPDHDRPHVLSRSDDKVYRS